MKTPLGKPTSFNAVPTFTANSKLAALSFEEHQEYINLTMKLSAYAIITHMNGNAAPILEETKDWPQKYKNLIV